MRTLWLSAFVLLASSAVACGGSDDGVSFAPGSPDAQAGTGGTEGNGEGEGGAAGRDPGPEPEEDPLGGAGGEAQRGGAAGNAAKGGGSGTVGKGGAPGQGGKGGGSSGGKGGGSGTGGMSGTSGAAGKGGDGSGETGPENTAARCGDGFDNDGDGFLDCADNDCRALLASCREDTLAACTDGLDNDADGHADCDDFDCQKDGIGAGCVVSTTCTDQHEPDDEAANASEIGVEEGGGPACSENHSICSGDVDRYVVRFEAFESGGTLDIRLRVFSQGSGTVTVKMHDPDGVAPDVTRTLTKLPETLKLLYDTAIVCDGDCGDEVVRELEVSFSGPSKPFYRVCGEML